MDSIIYKFKIEKEKDILRLNILTFNSILFSVLIEYIKIDEQANDCNRILEFLNKIGEQRIIHNEEENLCCVRLFMPDYGAHYYLDYFIKDNENFFAIMECHNFSKFDNSFKLLLNWKNCDKKSFYESIDQMIKFFEKERIEGELRKQKYEKENRKFI